VRATLGALRLRNDDGSHVVLGTAEGDHELHRVEVDIDAVWRVNADDGKTWLEVGESQSHGRGILVSGSHECRVYFVARLADDRHEEPPPVRCLK